MSADYKHVPYGIADFEQVRKENLYLVDKTMFFEKMERAGHFLFLVRPRRFGKSLFLDMLESYYDINQKDNFQELFKGLYVADHPTKEQGQFQVLHLDFSLVGSDLENLYENFNRYCCNVMDSFIDDYKNYYSPRVVEWVHRQAQHSQDGGKEGRKQALSHRRRVRQFHQQRAQRERATGLS